MKRFALFAVLVGSLFATWNASQASAQYYPRYGGGYRVNASYGRGYSAYGNRAYGYSPRSYSRSYDRGAYGPGYRTSYYGPSAYNRPYGYGNAYSSGYRGYANPGYSARYGRAYRGYSRW